MLKPEIVNSRLYKLPMILSILCLVSQACNPITTHAQEVKVISHQVPTLSIAEPTEISVQPTEQLPLPSREEMENENGNPIVLSLSFGEGKENFIVLQPPESQPAYVFPQAGVLTQFPSGFPKGEGGQGIAILAHNFSAGAYFGLLTLGSEVQIVTAAGGGHTFVINQISKYIAESPESIYSNFVLDDPSATTQNKIITSQELYDRVYKNPDTNILAITLQTCYQVGDDPFGGRIFYQGVESSD